MTLTATGTARKLGGKCVAPSTASSMSSARPAGPKRVFCFVAPAILQDPAGGEVQLRKTVEYLQQVGVNAALFDAWQVRFEPGDCLHLFGTLPEHVALARVARLRGARVALSTITWYDWRVSLRHESSTGRRLRAAAALWARRLFPALPSWRRELLHLADRVLPNSRAEADQIVKLFGVARNRIDVIPNGVDGRFEWGDAELFQAEYAIRDFVLMTGRFEPRKNQLGLIRALRGTGVPLVLVGDPHRAHADYFAACRHEADSSVRFLPGIDHDSAMLSAAYAAARVVVLPSWFETPGLSALEGALAGAAIVVTSLGSAREYFGDLAWYVAPRDGAGIRRAVLEAFQSPRRDALRSHVRESYLWHAVVRATRDAYARMFA